MALLSLPLARVRTLPWRYVQSPAFPRQHYLTAAQAAMKYCCGESTVRTWVATGKLSAVRTRGGWLLVDKRELTQFVKTLPKPGTKTRAKILRHQRMMRRRRMRRVFL